MLKAGALIYSLVISVLISLTLVGVILFQMFVSQNNSHLLRKQELHSNASSGFNLLLSGCSVLWPNSSKTLELYDEGNDSVFISRKDWGMYEVLGSEAFHRGQNSAKSALIGYADSTLGSLYLADHDKPLFICGKTKIEGSVFLPKAGVERAYIAGQSYSGSKMIYGTTKKSSNHLPRLDELWKERVGRFANGDWPFEVQELKLDELDSLNRDFFEKTILVHVGKKGYVQNQILNGNVILYASESLVVAPNNQLENVLVVAPSVTIQTGFSGQIQVISNQQILLEDGVSLLYPSGVCLYGCKNVSSDLMVGKRARVEGPVVHLTPDKGRSHLLTVEGSTKIRGMVYGQGMLQLKGSVIGSVYTNDFYLSTSAASYRNHLLNASIAPEAFKLYLGGVPMGNAYKGVLKWLN